MATRGVNYVDIGDVLKHESMTRVNARVIEILNETNPLIYDANVMMANQSTGHLTTVRDTLPEAFWVRFYKFVPSAKSTITQFMDSMGTLAINSTQDANLVEMQMEPESYRMDQDKAFVEGLGQQMNTAFLYSNTQLNPEQFLGIMPRYNSLSSSNPYSSQIIDAGGTGADNTSILMMEWGMKGVSLIYPRGSMTGGLEQRDQGRMAVPKVSSTGNIEWLDVYNTSFRWTVGCTIADYRRVVRIANIDVSEIRMANNKNYSGTDLIDLLIQATHVFGGKSMPVGQAYREGNTVIYANRSVARALDFMARREVSHQLMYDTYAGREITSFRGIPIRTLDTILDSEARVT